MKRSGGGKMRDCEALSCVPSTEKQLALATQILVSYIIKRILICTKYIYPNIPLELE